jgi:Mn-dependent DtxR family transcriptional regulator
MLIREIQHYLSEKKQAATGEISYHLQQDKEVVLHALRIMEQKGLVEEIMAELPCKGCSCGAPVCMKEKIYRKA